MVIESVMKRITRLDLLHVLGQNFLNTQQRNLIYIISIVTKHKFSKPALCKNFYYQKGMLHLQKWHVAHEQFSF